MRLRRALGLTAAVGVLLAGCSLVVDTSDLANGRPDAGIPPTVDGNAPVEAGTDSDLPDAEAGADSKPPVVELPGLIGAWLFEDGTARDSSFKKRDGTLLGDAKVVATDRGKAMQVDGTGSMTIASLDNGEFPQSGTLSIWFQYSQMDDVAQQGIFDEWASDRPHIFLRHPNGSGVGEIQVGYQDGANDYQFESGFDLEKQTWAHVVFTWDTPARYGRFFVDGAPVEADNYPNGDFSPTGQRMTFGKKFFGLVDDIRLYDHSLTDGEIEKLP